MIKVLQKCDVILRLVAGDDQGMTLLEIGRALRMHKATLSNILQTLQGLGYLERDAARRYTIGARLVALASTRRTADALRDIAVENTRALAEEVRETATVSILRDGDRFLLAKSSADRSVEYRGDPVYRPTPYASATGRLLVAYLDGDGLALVLKKHGLPGPLWEGIDDRERFAAVLSEIRRCEQACLRDADGHAESVAIPVCGKDRRVLAALGVGVPAYRFKGRRRREIIAALRAAGRRMETALLMRMGESEERR